MIVSERDLNQRSLTCLLLWCTEEASDIQEALVQAKSKKDAKQLAAAALLEVMLKHVPFQDLLYRSNRQQNSKDNQVNFLPVPAMWLHIMSHARCAVHIPED